MKTKTGVIFISLLVIGFSSCKSPEGEKTEAKDAQKVKKESAENITYNIQPEKSKVHWTGTKPGGEHLGTVKIKEGKIKMNDQGIKNATVILDMTSIENQDIDKEKNREKLVGHLKSKDFFDVENFPEAKFELTNATKIQDENNNFTHKVSGNLTIKDITRNISFRIKAENEKNMLKINSEKFLIDRTEWDINYKSKSLIDDLKDNFIHDDIGFKIKTVAN